MNFHSNKNFVTYRDADLSYLDSVPLMRFIWWILNFCDFVFDVEKTKWNT